MNGSEHVPVYVVAGCKSWNRSLFEERLRTMPGRWFYVDRPEMLTPEYLSSCRPDRIFFLHWSWKVPVDILENFECICFHMTDLPYGRGGSPLQNLILAGHAETKLTALRMSERFDAGPVYLKRDLSLEGTAAEILVRAGELSVEMIGEILSRNPTPVPQSGDATIFRRRTPAQSRLSGLGDTAALYDFIRMLDGEGYPPAFLEAEGFRFEFRGAARYDGAVVANVTITRCEETP